MQKTKTLKNPNPIGNIIVGSVLDVNKKHLERALKDYDSQLYVQWNPRKRNGLGIWEIRRRPTKKTAVFKTVWEGNKIYQLEYVEQDLVHHIMDVEYLNYNVLTRLKEMDSWNSKDWIGDMDYEAERAYERETEKNRAERKYMIKDNLKQLKALREEFLSGNNPLRHFKDWK